ncbi:hypothetical protein [Paenochrobactrum pullorum]|uniref:hypothetical protein n=1 Tax=Paenochrobactrum pullorum TaxID=1324351 RepID=UPI0035BBA8F1
MVTYPIDFLVTFPGWSTDFDLKYRQELSRTAGGVTLIKNLGSPLWIATYQTRNMRPNELDQWRARLKLLEGGLQEFLGRPTSRCYPIAYPKGQGIGNTVNMKLAAFGSGRQAVAFSGVPAGYSFTVGDFIQIGTRNLHQIVAVGSELEIRPHLWPETKVNDPVKIVRPSCKMIMVPETLTSTAELGTGRGSITFQAIESR